MPLRRDQPVAVSRQPVVVLRQLGTAGLDHARLVREPLGQGFVPAGADELVDIGFDDNLQHCPRYGVQKYPPRRSTAARLVSCCRRSTVPRSIPGEISHVSPIRPGPLVPIAREPGGRCSKPSRLSAGPPLPLTACEHANRLSAVRKSSAGVCLQGRNNHVARYHDGTQTVPRLTSSKPSHDGSSSLLTLSRTGRSIMSHCRMP